MGFYDFVVLTEPFNGVASRFVQLCSAVASAACARAFCLQPFCSRRAEPDAEDKPQRPVRFRRRGSVVSFFQVSKPCSL